MLVETPVHRVCRLEKRFENCRRISRGKEDATGAKDPRTMEGFWAGGATYTPVKELLGNKEYAEFS